LKSGNHFYMERVDMPQNHGPCSITLWYSAYVEKLTKKNPLEQKTKSYLPILLAQKPRAIVHWNNKWGFFFLVDKCRAIDMGIFDLCCWRCWRLLHNEGRTKKLFCSGSFSLGLWRSENPCFHGVLVRAWLSGWWCSSTQTRNERNDCIL